MKLAQFQKLMAEDVMRPLTRLDGIARENKAASYVRPNDRLTAVERLEIYNRSYWFRILDSLYEDFPGLRAVVGERAFFKLAEAYLTACPSTSFTMARLGAQLESWLRANPKWAGAACGLAFDMVRLEWAHIEAFDGLALTEIGPEDLAEFDAGLELQLQPYVQLLGLRFPVDAMRLRVNAAAEGQSAASNTVSEKRVHVAGVRSGRVKEEPVCVAVHRHDGYVYYRRLENAEFVVLNSLARGGRFGAVVTRAFRGSGLTAEEFQSSLQGWFTAWSQLGWLCHRPRKIKENRNQQ